jgi:tetratricopeptide (TPR) repeat protein
MAPFTARRVPLALALAAGLAAPALAAGPSPEVAALVARADAAYAVRDEPGKMDEAQAALDEAEKLASGDYGVLWRKARQLFWRADDLRISKEEKARLGKECWDIADRATAAEPRGPEGWFYAASGVGNYSLGMGVLRALALGMEGKFRERLERAEALDAKFDNGAIHNAWGRFYYELPWPKYDARRSEERLRAALKLNPANVRARVYLAELFRKEDKPAEARALLEEALAREPGVYDRAEERRWQERARELLAAKP